MSEDTVSDIEALARLDETSFEFPARLWVRVVCEFAAAYNSCKFEPDDVVEWVGAPCAMIDCFGMLSDEQIRRYIELGCEVKGLGRGHIKRIKEEVRLNAESSIPIQ